MRAPTITPLAGVTVCDYEALGAMMDWQNVAVVAGAVVFAVFLLWRMRPVRLGVSAVRRSTVDTMAARVQARSAPDARSRARILCDAARRVGGQPGGASAAIGLFLRAMKADPSWPEPVSCISSLLGHRRPHDLERILWRHLGSCSWADGGQREVAAACAHALAGLYRGRLKDRSRASALHKLAAELGPVRPPQA